MVGLAIFLSLIGRAKISTHSRLTSHALSSTIASPGIADDDTDWAKLEAQEKERIRKQKEEAESKANKEAAARKKADKSAARSNEGERRGGGDVSGSRGSDKEEKGSGEK